MKNSGRKESGIVFKATDHIASFICSKNIGIKVADESDLKALNARRDVSESRQEITRYAVSIILGVIVLALIFSGLYELFRETFISDGGLQRPDSGKGAEKVELTVTATDKSDGYLLESDYSINVSEIRLTGERLEKLFEEARSYIDVTVIGENASANEISMAVNLPKKIPGNSIQLEWTKRDATLIGRDGEVFNTDLDEPVITWLGVRMTYYDEERIYEFPLRIVPPETDRGVLGWQEVERAVLEADEESIEDPMLTLPTETDNLTISWSEKADNTAVMILSGGTILALLVIPILRLDVNRKLKSRNLEIEEDYPEFVSRYSLLISAGMTSRAALFRINEEYLTALETGSAKERYLYEELAAICNRIALGTSEKEAYSCFGNACGVPCCRRFGNLLASNIRRGSSMILEVLEKESSDAIEDRMSKAREQGERIGTKLLIPMMGFLGIVIAIIIVPAFSSL